MDRFDSLSARGHTTHQDQVLDLIKDYHYFAPAMLALGETQARCRSAAALGRREDPAALTDRSSLHMRVVRNRLSALLIRLGIELQGGYAREPGATTAIGEATSR
jgi:hypothetical protein